MNPPLTQAEALVQLKLLTTQTANFTFTDDEMNQALETAWNDTYVVDTVWDSSIVYTQGVWQYAIPLTMNVVKDLYYQRTTTDNPELLDKSLYEIVAGNIQFSPKAELYLLTGMTIYTKGYVKLTTDDELPTAELVNYVLYSAAETLLTQLLFKSTFVFLRNDITIPQITAALQVVQNRTLQYKQAITREYVSV